MTVMEQQEKPVQKEVSAPEKQSVSLRHPKRLLWVALVLGWSVDILFYGKAIGVSLLIFALLATVSLGTVAVSEKIKVTWRNGWLLLPLFFFAAMAFLRANPFLTFWNVVAVITILSYLIFFMAAGRVGWLGLIDASILPARVGGSMLTALRPALRDNLDLEAARQSGRKQLFPLLRGLLLALPILFVFTVLLASADEIFANYIERFFEIDLISELFTRAWRGLLIVLWTWLLGGGLVYAVRRRESLTNEQDDQSLLQKGLDALARKLPLGLIESLTVLSLINLLFGLFTAVQFTYLFGGRDNISLEGFTYAEYARRGFFELVVVAVLSLGLIMGLNWITYRQNKRQIRLFNALATMTVGFVLVLLLSAFRRMQLYEATFGYTELRLYVYFMMGWMAAFLLYFAATLWKRPDRIALGAILCAIGFLGSLNLVNPDAFIVRQNVERYTQIGDLDVDYLTTLSPDAVPALANTLSLVADDPEIVLKESCRFYSVEDAPEGCSGTRLELLQANLNGRFAVMTENRQTAQWPSFHLARWRAFQALQEVTERPEA